MLWDEPKIFFLERRYFFSIILSEFLKNRVALQQIEDFLRRNEKIKDVAVIGLPDQRLGEIAAAIIELKDGADCTETEIQDFCRELPRYKRPRRVIFAKVPRNPTGKIEKPVLRQIYCGGRLVEEQTKA